MKEAKKGSTCTLSVSSQAKGGERQLFEFLVVAKKSTCKKHLGLDTNMKEAKKGSTYTLSVPSQEKGGERQL